MRRCFTRKHDTIGSAGAFAPFLRIAVLLGVVAGLSYFADRPSAVPQTHPDLTAADTVPAAPLNIATTDWADIDPGDYRLSATGPEPTEVADDETATPEQRVVMVRRGDTLFDLLLGAGISRADAHEAVSALRGIYDPRALKPGQEITLTIAPPGSGEPASLLGANFTANAARDINLSRDAEGRFTAFGRNKELQRDLIRATGTVKSSLFEAGSAAGVPGAIMVDLIRAFSYDVDFQRDIQVGDTFEVVFERYRESDGRFAKDGDVLYGALTLSGTVKQIYRHTLQDGTAEFFTAAGESVRKALLKTPIDGARLTSGFGNRMHPILGYSAKHKGADFAAPPGTPIQAAGEGVIEAAGWNGAYGNYVRIRHSAEYATAYAHLSRIPAGARVGERVRQGQVIGYVGTTGRSTGPHLHYEVLKRGTQVNPISVQLPNGRKLDGGDLVLFRITKAELDLQVAALEPTDYVSRASRQSASVIP